MTQIEIIQAIGPANYFLGVFIGALMVHEGIKGHQHFNATDLLAMYKAMAITGVGIFFNQAWWGAWNISAHTNYAFHLWMEKQTVFVLCTYFLWALGVIKFASVMSAKSTAVKKVTVGLFGSWIFGVILSLIFFV